MNYAQITAEISKILKRGTSLDSSIPNWIAFAESNITAELRDCASTQTISTSLLVNTDNITYPSVILEPTDIYIMVSGFPTLLIFQTTLPPSDTSTGQPSFWTVDGATIRFDRLADQAYTLKIQCYGELDIATTNNWVGDTVPDAYIYGALMHSQVLTESQNVSYASYFDAAITKAKRLNAKRRGISSAILRTDIPRSVNNQSFDIRQG